MTPLHHHSPPRTELLSDNPRSIFDNDCAIIVLLLALVAKEYVSAALGRLFFNMSHKKFPSFASKQRQHAFGLLP
jgi:hypothetical protein